MHTCACMCMHAHTHTQEHQSAMKHYRCTLCAKKHGCAPGITLSQFGRIIMYTAMRIGLPTFNFQLCHLLDV